jgi:hypothetical protein
MLFLLGLLQAQGFPCLCDPLSRCALPFQMIWLVCLPSSVVGWMIEYAPRGEEEQSSRTKWAVAVYLFSCLTLKTRLAIDVQLLNLVASNSFILCYMSPSKPTGQLPPRNLAVSGPGILHLHGGLVVVSMTAMPVKLV